LVALRPAQAKDAPVLAALSIETWLNTYTRAGLGPKRAAYVLNEFSPRALMQAIEDEQVTVSDHNRGITGYTRAREGQIAPVGPCHGTELVTLYIRPAMQRQGIGHALLSNLVAQATRRGSPALWLTVNCRNHNARAFYKAHGFDPIGQTDFVLDGKAYPNFVLRRDLPGAG
jgi:ribosomal protein S18 acetylase RimI-like enzyme